MSNLERVTVNLAPRGRAAMRRILARGGKDKTAVINQSLVLADWLETEAEAGAEVFLRRPDGTERIVVLL